MQHLKSAPCLMLAIFSLAAQAQNEPRPDCEASPEKTSSLVAGEVSQGESFAVQMADRWLFKLVPMQYGWTVEVAEATRDKGDLARLTPPFHGINARYLEGWHFRNKDNTGPNTGDVNAPQGLRHFIFSPQVGRGIEYDLADDAMMEKLARVEAFGQGWLYVDSYTLTTEPGKPAGFLDMAFTVCLTWSRTDLP